MEIKDLKNSIFSVIVEMVKTEINNQSELELSRMEDDGLVEYDTCGDGRKEPSDKSRDRAYERACASLTLCASDYLDYRKLDALIAQIIKNLNSNKE